jgi:putative NADH-flavin reductase
MKLIIFGASRGVGRSLVELALAQQHQVTAFVRNRSSLDLNNSLLTVIAGDVTNAAHVKQAIKGQEMVFCTLGQDTRGATTLYSVAAHNITQAMNEQGIRRLMFLSNFGVLGETASTFRTFSTVSLAKLLLRDTLADHRRALNEIQKYSWEWMAVRPMKLTDGERTGQYRIALEGLPEGGTYISRADVADFMLKQVKNDEYVHTVPALAY